MPTPPDARYTKRPAAGAHGRGLRSSGVAAIRPHLPVTCTSPVCLQAPRPQAPFPTPATRWEYFQAVVMSRRGKASGCQLKKPELPKEMSSLKTWFLWAFLPFKIKALTDNIVKKGKGLLPAPRPGVREAQAQGRGSDCISPGRPSPAFPGAAGGRRSRSRSRAPSCRGAAAAAGHSKEHLGGVKTQ